MSFSEIMLFLVELLSGTGLFLVGVSLLTSNIEQLATSKIRNLFSKTADKKLVNVGIGTVTTALIQSSGVTTVLIVGFVNVGLMSLYQATAMIMGANIGTTITAQIAALSAFPITTYIQVLTFIGVMISMISKKDKIKKVGLMLAGLGLVFIGLDIMSHSMSSNAEAIQTLFSRVTDPFLLFFIGILLTAIVQSSSATTSIVISMSVAGLVIGTGGNEVLYIILGTNIGSCVTALMSSMGAGANAKRASLIHLMFNVFGSVIFFIFLVLFPSFMDLTFKAWFPSAATQIAMFHTFFNLMCTAIFLPFSNIFVKISQRIIKDKKKPVQQTYLDERLISSPSLAIAQLEKEMFLLSDIAMDSFLSAFRAFDTRSPDALPYVFERIEQAVDKSQTITNFMIRVSSNCSLSEEQQISDLHNNIGDIVRISEIADNFTKYTKREIEKNLEFSDQVRVELRQMVGNVEKLYGLTKQIVSSKDENIIKQIDVVEETIDAERKSIVDAHIERLNQGMCKPESSSIFINLVSNIERLGDHLTYIAYTLNSRHKKKAD